jgi:hypothetical protein
MQQAEGFHTIFIYLSYIERNNETTCKTVWGNALSKVKTR